MTSHIEVTLGTFPELVDIFTNELLGFKVDESRKEKLVSKLKKIEGGKSLLYGVAYLPDIGVDYSFDYYPDHTNKENADNVRTFLSKAKPTIGVTKATAFMSDLVEEIGAIKDDTLVFTYGISAFNDWRGKPTQIMQPWRTKRLPLVFLHYRDVDGINLAGIDKLNTLEDIIDLASLYTDRSDGGVGAISTINSNAIKAITTVLNNITHVKQFNRFVKLLSSTPIINEIKAKLYVDGVITKELEDDFEIIMEDINIGLFRTSIDIRKFTLLRLIDLLLG